jgi:4-hydroxybenzoate polyprenyltransferase
MPILFFVIQVSAIRNFGVRQLPWGVMIAFSCLLGSAYLVNRLTDSKEDKISQITEVIESPTEKRAITWLAILLAGLPVVWLALRGLNYIPYLLLCPVLFIYSLKLPLIGKLKNRLLIKNLYSACLGWALPIGVVILVYSGSEMPRWAVLLTCLEIAGLTLIIELIWDIRDIDGDRASGVRTVANTFGVLSAKAVAGGILLLVVLMKLLCHPNGVRFFPFLFGSFIVLADKRRSPIFFHAIIVILVIYNLTWIVSNLGRGL